jgi:hypothetical protein
MRLQFDKLQGVSREICRKLTGDGRCEAGKAENSSRDGGGELHGDGFGLEERSY